MTRPNPAILAGFLLSFLIIMAGASLTKGGFFIGKHEGDTLHLMQIVLRMAAGEWPHLDFSTPIGVLAFAPISLMVKLGFGAGQAILFGQILVAIVFFPAVWWVSSSRFSGGWAYLFGGALIVLIVALVHGEADRAVSISMHYNRWAWAAGFLVMTTALLPAFERQHPAADGMVIGLGMAFLALCKVTYFVGFAPAVLVAILGRRSGRTLLWALGAGLVVAGIVTLLAGAQFWLAYMRDLLSVSGSEVRARPGLEFTEVIGAPAYMGASLVGIFSVILLRQSERMLEGLVMLILLPGVFYITYQNFGNDPQWVALVGLYLFALRPLRDMRNALGWDLQKAMALSGAAALAFAAPSFINMTYSPFRHLVVDIADHVPLMPGSGRHEDLQTLSIRAHRIDGKIAMDGEDSIYAAFNDPEFRTDIAEFRGEVLPQCSLELGMIAWFSTIAADLQNSGFADGKSAFVADILSSYWLFGAFEPLKGGTPWYYGGLPGFSNADLLLVPLCPLSTSVRKQVLDAVTEAGVPLEEVRRTDLYVLYAISP